MASWADAHAGGAIEGKDAQFAGQSALLVLGHPALATLSQATEQAAAIWAGEQLPLHAVDAPASSFEVFVLPPQPTAKLRAATHMKPGSSPKDLRMMASWHMATGWLSRQGDAITIGSIVTT